jgi:hypothetical protein
MQDDSVFADFDVDDEGHIFLLRISFDGYGCYDTAEEATRMDPTDSRLFIHLIEAGNVESEDLAAVLFEYLKLNKDVIGNEPLVEHSLLENDILTH